MMTDADFVSETVDEEDGPSIRVIVRCVPTGESRSVVLRPESWQETKREYAVYVAIGQLKQKLGREFPNPDFTHEIIGNRYFCGADKGSITVLQHKPSGITSRIIHHDGIKGREALRERNKVFEEFLLLLWEAGIRPQPKEESVKRLGKPRWSEEKRSQEGGATDGQEQ